MRRTGRSTRSEVVPQRHGVRTDRQLLGVAAVALAVGATVAACGSSSSSGGSAGGQSVGSSASATTTTAASAPSSAPAAANGPLPNGCTLLTADDITKALGTAPVAPPTGSGPGQCSYASKASSNFVNLRVDRNMSTALFEQAANGGGATKPVSGLGDAAFQSASGATVFVLTGEDAIRVDVFVPAKPAEVQKLASDVLSALAS